MNEYIGIDIGGTKISVIRGDAAGNILEKKKFATKTKDETLKEIFEGVSELMNEHVTSIGVSCGGPLNSKTGVILGPPNLPGWDEVPITDMLTERFKVPAYLKNDADACAVAEWKFGAGKGTENMIFLAFGTGIGAGLILNGRLYEGSTGMAGETGHLRLFETGHIGHGKAGSFEGYVSGGGIAQYGKGTAKELGKRAAEGDPEALALWNEIGENLGKLLAILIDLFNPEAIVIGSIYARAGEYMKAGMEAVIEKEALPGNVKACRILPAGLGEKIGDIAALSVAMHTK